MKRIRFFKGPHDGETAEVNKDVERFNFCLPGVVKDEHGYNHYSYDEYKPKRKGLLDFFFVGRKGHKVKPIDYSQDDS